MPAGCYIDGVWVPTAATFEVTDPATRKVVGVAADAGPELASTAIGAAHGAFDKWADWTAQDRAEVMRRISAELLARLDHIADVIVSEQGKPRAQAIFEVRYATQWLGWFAEEGRRAYGEVVPSHVPGKRLIVQQKPLGVAVAVTPWNFPLAMIVRKLAPAMAAGCTMVVKPAEQTPLSAVALFQAIERADVPEGVCNLVTSSSPGSLAAPLLEDPRVRKITFTGSTEVGKLLVRASATNLARVSLELGGQAPFIVFDDADLDAAVEGALMSKFQVNGQSCLCANRIFVQDAVAKDFTARLAAAVSKLKVGAGAEEGVDVGPLIDDAGLQKVEAHVADALARGANVETGGGRAVANPDGCFFEPTVLSGCTDEMMCASDETFGPVAPVLTFQTEAEVITRANHTRYGLAAYVYTRDLGRAMRASERLEFGMVGVNDPMPASPTAPFGGFKESGLGREGGHDGLEAFLEKKLVSFVC
ncbi:MAG: succinate-semialdehyde dehydrogenase (NADP(+)) [Chloroflexi bacterium]|nr:succinate-semialdehyde dehydrogenase (NADP(+)) [Chloroflexota bacterium]|tara:strand:- start:2542 stop:3969 length:1428 start_codon:yes stop_codon:yes gene_type:complete